MANFLENIFAQLQRAADRVVLQELQAGGLAGVRGGELLEQVRRARAFLRRAGLQPGDRCALLGPNSIRWITLDLALMAEGVVVIPLYARQAPAELAAMLQDAQPRFLFCSDAPLGEGIAGLWPRSGPPSGPQVPPRVLFEEVLRSDAHGPAVAIPDQPIPLQDAALVTIIYTSGTSGEAKGVCLNLGNVNHMLGCTTARLNQLMASASRPDRVFHYLPFNFAGSWILLLSCLARESQLTLSMDLTRLADDMRLAAPDYFLNVPTLLERVRRGVEEAIAKRSKPIRALFARARTAWQRQHAGRGQAFDGVWFDLGRMFIFSKIRVHFGPHLRAIICGSAPLAPETQQFFHMLGVPVLQVYGLTETTAICTMDDPRQPPEPGFVGPAIPGIEMKIGEHEEILVRGPHIFPGYWKGPEETARVLQDGWFRTGDQGEVNVRGNWRIVGRLKNLVILNSGHNIAPEPIEEKLQQLLPAAQQVVLVGNGRGYLGVLVSGAVEESAVRAALGAVNPGLPHYRQVRGFRVLGEAFTPENGLLTANGKLRRDAINSRFASEINAMYDVRDDREAVGKKGDRKAVNGKPA
jgi:long-chain acyl-CoA synthetase